jgi:hypothetical protein
MDAIPQHAANKARREPAGQDKIAEELVRRVREQGLRLAARPPVRPGTRSARSSTSTGLSGAP